MNTSSGIIKQVMGPVVDVEFPDGRLPDIYTALKTTNPSIDQREENLTLEVAQHLGENTSARTWCAASPWTARTASPAGAR